jgi:hypothetical protein
MRVAFASMAWKTDSTSLGELEMTRSTSDVAACRSSASRNSLLSRATSDSESSAGDRRLLRVFGAFRPFGLSALWSCALAGLRPALDGFFIASTRGWERGIVAGHSNTGHGTRARPTLSRAAARPAPTTRRQTHPAAFLGRFSPLLEAEYISDVADAGLRALAT